jgi:hypothetical protein
MHSSKRSVKVIDKWSIIKSNIFAKAISQLMMSGKEQLQHRNKVQIEKGHIFVKSHDRIMYWVI